jgi:hypothetical protein
LAAAILLIWGGTCVPVSGNDLVLNDGFDLQSTQHWIETGNIPTSERGVAWFDVTGDGKKSWAYYQHPGDGFSGGVDQVIHVQAGVTYSVKANFCYANC